MNEKWYCRIGDREFGPLLIAQLQRLSTRGQLTADSPVRRDNSNAWMTASQVPALQSFLGEGSQALPTAKRLEPSPQPAMPQPAPAQPTATKITTSTPQAAPAPPQPGGVAIVTGQSGVADRMKPAHTTEEATGLSRGAVIGLLAGLGGVVVILVVILVVVLTGGGDDEIAQSDASKPTPKDSGPVIPSVEKTGLDEKRVEPPKTYKAPLVDKWSKARSTKVIKNKRDGSDLCRIRVNAVWASDDPTEKARTVAPPVAHSDSGEPKKTVRDDDVLDLEALQISKKRRVDATGKILDPGTDDTPDNQSPEPAGSPVPPPGGSKYVFIEVNLTNSSPDRTLNYQGWNGDGETTASKDAKLFRQDYRPCLFVSRLEAPRTDRLEATELSPGQSIVDVLVFELPGDGFESLKLALPRTAFGLAGPHLGFEFQRIDIAGVRSTSGPTGPSKVPVEPPVDSTNRGDTDTPMDAIERGIQAEDNSADMPAKKQPVEPAPMPKPDADEEFKKLQDSIENSRD